MNNSLKQNMKMQSLDSLLYTVYNYLPHLRVGFPLYPQIIYIISHTTQRSRSASGSVKRDAGFKPETSAP